MIDWQVGFWLLGHWDINGASGYENPLHVDFKKVDFDVPPRVL